MRDLATYIDEQHLYGRHGFAALDWLMRSLLDGAGPPHGRALEIGAGEGLMSLWLLHAGAEAVTSLEPEAAGATEGVAARAARHRESLGLGPGVWDYRPDTLQTFDAQPNSYDLILSYASVNHLDEDACTRLLDEAEARRRYVELFGRIRDLLRPGGTLVLADVARSNYWSLIGKPSPWAPEIEWHKHQEPETWSAVAHEAGLQTVSWQWHFPYYRARRLAPLLNHRTAARCLASGFVIRARRPRAAST